MRHEQRYAYLDIVRGLCAIVVCAGHLRNVMFVDYAKLGKASLLENLFYLVTGLGHEAVMVFFVLSGFFVGGSVLRNWQYFDWKQYLITRLTRLWVVLIPALVVTSCVDSVISYLHPEVIQGAYRESWNSGPSVLDYSSALSTFIANVLFLQTISAPVYGTNGPLWSLANEFWYYISFPILLTIVIGRKATELRRFSAERLIAGVALCLLAWFLKELAFGFIVWLFGLLTFLGSKKLSDRGANVCVVLGIGLTSVALVASRLVHTTLGAFAIDFGVGLSFCLLGMGLVQLDLRRSRMRLRALGRYLSEPSYSLYLYHFPAVLLIGATFYGGQKIRPSVWGICQFFGWLACLLAYGVFAWWLFERRTDRIRKWIKSSPVAK